jgi:hypothetical protein
VNKKVFLISMLLCASFNVTAQSTPSVGDLIDPDSVSVESTANAGVIERVLEEPADDARYAGLKAYVEHYGPWVRIKGEDREMRIHINSYLIQRGFSEDAAVLIKNQDTQPWLSYSFQGGVANDFMMAMNNGDKEYLQSLFQYAPEGIGSEMVFTASGDKATPLALMATNQFVNSPIYEWALNEMLASGANPHSRMSNDLSPMIIASSSNNGVFTQAAQSYLSGDGGKEGSLLKNSPLSQAETFEMQALVDAWIEKTPEEIDSYSTERIFELWVQLIMRGFNFAADMLYDELKTRDGFDVDGQVSKGITPLMATALSRIYGGNVEYAKKLVERGADPHSLVLVPGDESTVSEDVEVNLIQLSLERDNYKVIAYLISQGVNFMTLPDNDEILILQQATEQKSYKSAYIIFEAVTKELSEMSGEQAEEASVPDMPFSKQ